MPEPDDELREMLRRRAAAVPPRMEPPPRLLRRARGRIALNATVALIVVGAAVGGVAAVAGLVNRSPHRLTAGRASAGAPPACGAGDLKATLDLNGHYEDLVGSVVLTAKGTRTCTLKGTPTVTILSAGGSRFAVVQMTGTPWWAQGPSTAPPGWPAVTLSRGDRARVHVRWANWCPPSEAPQTWSVRLPGGAGTVQATVPRQVAPGCTDPSSPSTIDVGPFEPYAPVP